ncbi:MAG: hypothetical protein Q4D16_03525 [Eubacteriales bacterium]|nr:hypothetical protein [Eubacteriales bacterium]
MIYRAYSGGKEIKDFYVGRKETKEIWGGDTLLWEKEREDYGEFQFEYEYKIVIYIRGANIRIDWGDGTEEQCNWMSENLTQPARHKGKENRLYIAKITGNIKYLGFNTEANGGTTASVEYGYRNLTRVLTRFPKTMKDVESFYYLFNYCEKLYDYPDDLFLNTPKLKEIRLGFRRTKITKISHDLFKYTENLEDVSSCFDSTLITEIPRGFLKNKPRLSSVDGCFNATKIKAVPNDLFESCGNITSYNGLFSACKDLTRVEDGFGAKNNGTIINAQSMFYECTNLEYVPSDLLNSANPYEKGGNFSYIFRLCKNLQNAPKLYERFPGLEDMGQRTLYAYYMCEKLPWYDEIPRKWVDEYVS